MIKGKGSKYYWILIFFFVALYFRFVGGTWLIHVNDHYYSQINLIIISGIFLVIVAVIGVFKGCGGGKSNDKFSTSGNMIIKGDNGIQIQETKGITIINHSKSEKDTSKKSTD